MEFAYRAMDVDGRVRRGHKQAAHAQELEARLAAEGLDLITCRVKRLPVRRGARGLRRELLPLCVQLEQLTGSGVPLMDGLRDIARDAENARLRELLEALATGLEQGRLLSDTLAEHPQVFDAVFVALVRVGEQTGHLAEVLRDLADTLRWQQAFAARLGQALMYPALVAIVVFGVLSFLLISVVPQLVAFVANLDGRLPVATRALLAASEAFVNYVPWLATLVMVGWAGLRFRTARDLRWRERVDAWRLRLWPLGPLRHKAELARITRVIALMYAAGVPLLDGLATAPTVTRNSAVSAAMAQVRRAVLDGAPLGRAFRVSGLFPPLVVRMVTVGENSGALDAALLRLSEWFERDVNTRLARLERAIEPAVTLVLGALLGWIVLAVLGPIYELAGTLP
ncbi:MAG: type II secretion system F family protein [Gammaproteobacteria bacterium]|nr:type II secretion system F family protein [Gammaproteobacteria bacterium]